MRQQQLRRRFHCFSVLVSMGLAGLAGCSGSVDNLPDRVPVSGQVLYRGQPVDGAKVVFAGDPSTPPAVGITDSEGQFQLTTRDPGDGAIPGTYTVTVTKAVTAGAAPPANESMEQALQRAKESEQTKSGSALPDRYADPTRSNLEFTVEEGQTNEFDIELTD